MPTKRKYNKRKPIVIDEAMAAEIEQRTAGTFKPPKYIPEDTRILLALEALRSLSPAGRQRVWQLDADHWTEPD